MSKKTTGRLRLHPAAVVLPLLLWTAFASLTFLTGCAGVPQPDPRRDSMLILFQDTAEGAAGTLEITSPSYSRSVRISGGTEKIHYIKLPSGSYRLKLRSDGPAGSPGGITAETEIRPDTVFLFYNTVISSDAAAGTSAAPEKLVFSEITPEKQRRVSKDLTDYINFSGWYGKYFEGFGAYKPRSSLEAARYDFEIVTDPAGARVVIDGNDWGASPITVQLEPGRHLLRIEKEGYEPVRTFLNVDFPGAVTLSLNVVPAEETSGEAALEDGGREEDRTYALLIPPLDNMGNPEYDYLNTVFSDGIAAGLVHRENITVIRGVSADPGAQTASDAGGEAGPDFETAEERGAEFLVSGTYSADRDLFVQAALYDVRTRQVKTSIMYTGKAGLEMFESIDAMTEEFVANLSRVLPDPGEGIIEKRQAISREIISYRQKVGAKEIIAARHARRHSLSGIIAYGNANDSITDPDYGGYNSRSQAASFGPMVQWEILFGKFIGLSVMGGVTLYTPTVETDVPLGMDFPLYVGPSFVFTAKKIDLSIGIDGHFRFIAGVPYSYTSGTSGTIGPFFMFGLALRTNLKAYLNRRMSSRPVYLLFGLNMDAVAVRVTTGFTEPLLVPFSVWMYLGAGVRL